MSSNVINFARAAGKVRPPHLVAQTDAPTEAQIDDGTRFVAEIAMTTAENEPLTALAILKRAGRLILKGGGRYEEEDLIF